MYKKNLLIPQLNLPKSKITICIITNLNLGHFGNMPNPNITCKRSSVSFHVLRFEIQTLLKCVKINYDV